VRRDGKATMIVLLAFFPAMLHIPTMAAYRRGCLLFFSSTFFSFVSEWNMTFFFFSSLFLLYSTFKGATRHAGFWDWVGESDNGKD